MKDCMESVAAYFKGNRSYLGNSIFEYALYKNWQELEHLKEFIDGLPDGSFDKPKLASQRKKALFNKIDEVVLKVAAGNYTDAISKLFHDIRAKMDGDSTAQDWIIDSVTQFKLCVIIDHIIESITILREESG